MGFFDDFKEDLSQAVDELNSADAEKDVMPEDVPVPEPTFDFGGDPGETAGPDLRFDAKVDTAEEPLIDVAPLEEIAIEEPLSGPEAMQENVSFAEPQITEETEGGAAAGTEPELSFDTDISFDAGMSAEPEAEPEAAAEPGITEESAPEIMMETEAIAVPEAITEPEAIAEAEAVAEPEAMADTDMMAEPEAMPEPEVMPEPEIFTEPEAGPVEEAPAEEAPAVLDTGIFAGIGEQLTDTAPEAEYNTDERNEQMDTFNEDIIEGLDLPDLEEGPEVDESGSVTAGMTINGDITSGGSLEVIGTVKGNINVRGKLNVSGSITGNSKAAEIFADSAKVIGEMISSGAVKVGQESVIIGNITATSAVIAGAVKGNIDVKGPVILDTSAIVMGDIKSKSVQINNGAVIEGHCSQCYAEVSPTSFFEDVKGAIDKNK